MQSEIKAGLNNRKMIPRMASSITSLSRMRKTQICATWPTASLTCGLTRLMLLLQAAAITVSVYRLARRISMPSSCLILHICLAMPAGSGLHFGCLAPAPPLGSINMFPLDHCDHWHLCRPTDGEIDIIEGVNHQSRNTVSVHAINGCFPAGESCLVNNGCEFNTEDSFIFDDGFNNVDGGVYVIEWTFEHINIWFWPRGRAPSDVTGVNPNPIAWSTPTVSYRQDQGCIMDDHFQNMRLVFDIAFCGDWAGQPAIFDADGQCPGTCEDTEQSPGVQGRVLEYEQLKGILWYCRCFAMRAYEPYHSPYNDRHRHRAPIAQQYLQPLVEVMSEGH